MGKGKKSKNSRIQDSSSQELEDIMAWGQKKQNYYGEDENEYSSASQQYHEAQQIYKKQQNNLNDDQFYQFPQQDLKEGEAYDGESEDEGAINQQYIKKQIEWCLDLIKLFRIMDDEKTKYRNQVTHHYLLILLCLKEFHDIDYVQHHPMISDMAYLRKGLKQLQTQFEKFTQENQLGQEQEEDMDMNGQIDGDDEELEDYEGEDDDDIESEEQIDEEDEQIDEEDEGLQIYNQIKNKNDQTKKIKKMEQKQLRAEKLANVKVFKTVKDNEGRLASEKIIKNKGLIKKRKKIDGNSRVKLREKFRKAQIKLRTKGKIGVKQNPGRHYQGQQKILYGKIGSTKL